MEMRPAVRHVWAANNSPISIEGEIDLPFILNDRCLWTTALVSEDVEEVMLGIDWLERYSCIWDFKTGSLCIDGQPAVILTRRGHIKCRRVLAQGYQEIPPRSQMDVSAKVTLLSSRDSGEDIIVETNQLRPGLYVGRTLLPSSHHDVKICVANTTSKPQLISAGSCLGQVMSVTLPINKGGESTSDQISLVQHWKSCPRILPMSRGKKLSIYSVNMTVSSQKELSI